VWLVLKLVLCVISGEFPVGLAAAVHGLPPPLHEAFTQVLHALPGMEGAMPCHVFVLRWLLVAVGVNQEQG